MKPIDEAEAAASLTNASAVLLEKRAVRADSFEYLRAEEALGAAIARYEKVCVQILDREMVIALKPAERNVLRGSALGIGEAVMGQKPDGTFGLRVNTSSSDRYEVRSALLADTEDGAKEVLLARRYRIRDLH